MTTTIDAVLFLDELATWFHDYAFGSSPYETQKRKLTSILERIRTARVMLEASRNAAGYTYSSEFAIGNAVHIDGDKTLTATVTGLMFRSFAIPPVVECSWMLGGDSKVQIFESWRLKRANE